MVTAEGCLAFPLPLAVKAVSVDGVAAVLKSGAGCGACYSHRLDEETNP